MDLFFCSFLFFGGSLGTKKHGTGYDKTHAQKLKHGKSLKE